MELCALRFENKPEVLWVEHGDQPLVLIVSGHREATKATKEALRRSKATNLTIEE